MGDAAAMNTVFSTVIESGRGRRGRAIPPGVLARWAALAGARAAGSTIPAQPEAA